MPKKHTFRKFYELPEEYQQIKHTTIEGASYYIMLEDGRIWSRIFNRFMSMQKMHGIDSYVLTFDNGKKRTTTVAYLLRKCFNPMPEFEGVQHKPLKGYEDFYQIYSNGMIWSKRHNLFLSVCQTKQKYDLVCLQGYNKKLKTFYIYRLVYQNFVGEIPEKYQIHHINGNHRDNSIQNLQLVTAKVHRNYHYSLKTGVKMSEQKYIKINKIK